MIFHIVHLILMFFYYLPYSICCWLLQLFTKNPTPWILFICNFIWVRWIKLCFIPLFVIMLNLSSKLFFNCDFRLRMALLHSRSFTFYPWIIQNNNSSSIIIFLINIKTNFLIIFSFQSQIVFYQFLLFFIQIYLFRFIDMI